MTGYRLAPDLMLMRGSALLGAALLCSACAHASGAVDAARFPASTPLGTVAVVVTLSPSSATTVAGPPSRAGAAGREAMNVAGGTTAVLTALGSGYGLLLGVFISPITATIGAIKGAVQAADPGEVAPRVAALERALAAFEMREILARAVVASARPGRPLLQTEDGSARAMTRLELEVGHVELENYPSPPGLRYGALQEYSEIGLWRRSLSTETDPVLTLVIRIRARLVSADDGRALFERKLIYVGQRRNFSQWSDNDAAVLTADLAQACSTVAEGIVDELL
jgi:hypothetical protein